MKRSKRSRTSLLVFVIVAAGVALATPGLLRHLAAFSTRTMVAAPSVLEDVRTLSAVVVRDEAVVFAPRDGVFVPLVQEEERVRTGQLLGMLVHESGETAVAAPRPGIARFHWDGWETRLTRTSVWQRTAAAWRRQAGDSWREELGTPPEDGRVRAGDPLLRLVGGHGVALYVDEPEGAAWRSGQSVVVTLPDAASEPLRTVVAQSGETGDGGGRAVLLELNRYLPVLDAVRHVDATVVLFRVEGVVLPVASVLWEDGVPGVVVERNGNRTFLPVRLVGQVGDLVAVEGVPSGERIVVNPSRIVPGRGAR